MSCVKICRSIEKWEWFDDPTMVYFWLRVLLMANETDTQWQGCVIPKGMFLTSAAKLSADLGMSKKKALSCLESLAGAKMIEVSETEKKGFLVSICNYDKFVVDTDTDTKKENNPLDSPFSPFSSFPPTTPNSTISSITPIIPLKKKREIHVSVDDLPYHSEEFVNTWNTLLQQPKWRNKTDNAIAISLKRLAEFEEPFAIMLMNDSIEHNWQGVVFDNTMVRYQAWLKSRAKEGNTTPPDAQDWKKDHHLYSYEDFMQNDPAEFEKLLPVMQKDLKAGKKILRREGLWDYPEDFPQYEIYE